MRTFSSPWLAACGLLVGCGRFEFGLHGDAAAVVAIDTPASDADRFGVFSNPQVIPAVNSTAREFGASISRDELELYFISNRTGTYAMYRATRASTAVDFDAPVTVPIGGNPVSGEPSLARGGLDMFVSYSTGPTHTHRMTPQAAWAATVTDTNLAAYSGADFGAGDLHVVLFDTTSNQLYEATRPDLASPWATPTLITELANYMPFQNYPTMTDDGLEIVWQAFTTVNGAGTILHAVRPALDQPFGAPSPAVDAMGMAIGDPGISGDGRTLYYSAGPAGNSDLWIAQRP